MFDPKFAGEDLTKLAEEQDMGIERVIQSLKCMQGIEAEFIPKFKFFQFKKCYIKD